jgi:hypothetical protein
MRYESTEELLCCLEPGIFAFYICMYSCAVAMAVCLLVYLSLIRGITMAGTQKTNSSRS